MIAMRMPWSESQSMSCAVTQQGNSTCLRAFSAHRHLCDLLLVTFLFTAKTTNCMERVTLALSICLCVYGGLIPESFASKQAAVLSSLAVPSCSTDTEEGSALT